MPTSRRGRTKLSVQDPSRVVAEAIKSYSGVRSIRDLLFLSLRWHAGKASSRCLLLYLGD